MHIVVLSEELEARDNEKEIEYFLNARLGEDFDAETLELLKLKPKGMSADVTAEHVIELAQVRNLVYLFWLLI